MKAPRLIKPSFAEIHNAILDEARHGIPFPFPMKRRNRKMRPLARPLPERTKKAAKASSTLVKTPRVRVPTQRATEAKEKLAVIAAHKLNGCTACGYNVCKRALEFHHTDPSQKLFTINDGRFDGMISLDALVSEIAKCRVLCRNCHAEVHAGLRILAL